MSEEKKAPVDYSKFLTEEAAGRKANSIRELMEFAGIPGIVNLAGGMPNPSGFPIKGVTLTLDDGSKIDWSPQQVKTALLYGSTWGLPPLRNHLKKFCSFIHSKEESKDWELLITSGAQGGLSHSCDMLINRGDSIILGEPAYPGLLSNLIPKKANLVGVDMDSDGIDCDQVEAILANWETGPNAGRITLLPPPHSTILQLSNSLSLSLSLGGVCVCGMIREAFS